MNARLSTVLPLVASLLFGAAAGAEEGDVEAGRQLYTTRTCNLCHSIGGESGPMAQFGGPLDHLAAKRDAAWIRSYLIEPKSVLPDSPMPGMGLTEQEIADLTAFLLSH